MKRLIYNIKRIPLFVSLLTISFFLQGQDDISKPHSSAITPERIAVLPEGERTAWPQYYDRSQSILNSDKAVLAAELKANNLSAPLPAFNDDPNGLHIPKRAELSWFSKPEARAIADAIVSFQTPSGGWSKGVGFNSGLRKPGMHWTTKADGWYYVGTFDNGATTGQLIALSKFHQATKDPKYAAAFTKGLDYIFVAQYPNGGWPQNYPLVGWYHDAITFNDNAMTNVVQFLKDVAEKEEYSFVDKQRREKARIAFSAGVSCILKAQIKENGELSAWCSQHDPLTLAPTPGRSFEPASVSGWEGANVVSFLMSIDSPSPEIRKAVEGVVLWFQKVKVTGIEIQSKLNNAGGRMFVAVPNPAAPPVWARFYELKTNRPIFLDRQSKIYYTMSELDQSGDGRGYHWYVTQPGGMLARYAAWHEKWNPEPGRITLHARDVAIKGKNARLENESNIGYWSDPDTSFEWQADIPAGVYLVKMNYALAPGQEGSEIQIKVGDAVFKVTPPATGGWEDYRLMELGKIEIKKDGKVLVELKALSKKNGFIMNMAAVKLAKED
ncbi:MAG TPA: pectate lyase [Lentisphaeria bacterium]|nr:MAG: pectate lyase [Lentisphaerae bacterium GWF2_50_93]HCE42110.1 pectate lyase [Lentisphaeria bacterium]